MQSIRVVLVTDDTAQARSIRELLAEHVELIHAKNLRDLQHTLMTHSCAAIFCEWSYSNGRWRDVLETARALLPDTPVIVLSRSGAEREWLEVLEAGGFDLLVPPYSGRLMLSIVEDAQSQSQPNPGLFSAASRSAKAS